MIAYVIERLRNQVDNIIISANQDIPRYKEFGYPVIPDLAEFKDNGPLAGIISCARHVENTELLQITTCDSPFLPPNLTKKLLSSLSDKTSIAVPFDGQRLQPLHMLMPYSASKSLAEFLNNNMRSVNQWLDTQNIQTVDFSNEKDNFFNINTLDDLSKSQHNHS